LGGGVRHGTSRLYKLALQAIGDFHGLKMTNLGVCQLSELMARAAISNTVKPLVSSKLNRSGLPARSEELLAPKLIHSCACAVLPSGRARH
jgi:hypothetical protein